MLPRKSLIDRWWPEAAMLGPMSRDLLTARGLPLVLATAAILQLFERAGYLGGVTFLIGVFVTVAAAPFGALMVLDSETNGRLDQLRLYGMATGALARTVIAASVLPFLVIGVAFLSFSAPTVTAAPVLAVAFAGTAAIATAALLGGFWWRPGVGQAIAAVGLASAFGLAVSLTGLLESVGRLSTRTTAATIGILAVAVLTCAPVLLRALQRPAPRRHAQRMIVPVTLPLAIGPEAARIMRLALPAACLCLVAVLLSGVTLVVRETDSVGLARLLLLTPFLVAAIMIVATGREEAMAGRLAVLRGAPMPPTRLVAQVVAGWLLPFVPAITAGIAFAMVEGRGSLAVLGPVIAAALALPAAVIEGWLAPAALHFLGLAAAGPLVLIAIAFQRDTLRALVEIVFVGWIPFAVAISAYVNPANPRPALPVQAAMLAGVAASLFGYAFNRQQIFVQGFWLVSWVLAMGPLLAGPGRRDRLVMCGTVVVVALVSAGAGLLSMMAAAVTALGTIGALGVTWHVDRIAPGVPSMLGRLILAYLTLIISIASTTLDQYEWPWFSRPYLRDPLFTAVRIGAIVIAAAIVVAALQVWRRHSRARPATVIRH